MSQKVPGRSKEIQLPLKYQKSSDPEKYTTSKFPSPNTGCSGLLKKKKSHGNPRLPMIIFKKFP